MIALKRGCLHADFTTGAGGADDSRSGKKLEHRRNKKVSPLFSAAFIFYHTLVQCYKINIKQKDMVD